MPGKQLTHFLCLPLVNPNSRTQLQASLQHFATAAVDRYNVPPKAMRPIGTIHLTIGVMNLSTEEQVQAAASYLRSLDVQQVLKSSASASSPSSFSAETLPKDRVTSEHSIAPAASASKIESHPGTEAEEIQKKQETPEPLIVGLTGLQSMHNPAKTSILYASPSDPSSRLRGFCEALRSQFTLQGLLLPDDRPLLLHATILNTLYAKVKRKHAPAAGQHQHKRDFGKLDATALMGDFGAYEWAKDIHIEKISICKMGANKEIVDGVVINEEYTEVASVPLP